MGLTVDERCGASKGRGIIGLVEILPWRVFKLGSNCFIRPGDLGLTTEANMTLLVSDSSSETLVTPKLCFNGTVNRDGSWREMEET